MRRYIIPALLFATLGLAAACGVGDGKDGGRPTPLALGDDGIVPIPGNSELVIGPNRFALGLIDEENSPILEEPGTGVHFRFVAPNGGTVELDARFVWAIPDANGFWTADVVFDDAGQWQVHTLVSRDAAETEVRPFSFPVRQESQIPTVGDAAPPSVNLTLAQEPNIKRLSTDQQPEPALYELTVAEALEAGRPLVVVFATPAFCQTRFCGPVVDNVKAVWQDFGDRADFIHIEPFELDDDGQLVTGPDGFPAVSAPMAEWSLQTEPWIFVVDADGRIAARFEGAASPSEIEEALLAVLS